MIETLEKRTLMAATIPTATAAAYAALQGDAAAVRALGQQITAEIHADEKLLAADVKQSGASKSNQKVLHSIDTSAAKVNTAALSGINQYLRTSATAYRRMELAIANFSAKPNLADGHALAAADNAVQIYTDYFYAGPVQSLIAKYGDYVETKGSIASAVAALAADNSSDTQLATDAQKIQTDISNFANDVYNESTTIGTDVGALTS